MLYEIFWLILIGATLSDTGLRVYLTAAERLFLVKLSQSFSVYCAHALNYSTSFLKSSKRKVYRLDDTFIS